MQSKSANNVQSTALKSIRSLVPLLDRVLVQRMKSESKTAGGIFLPESSVKELNEAKVLAVGPGGMDKDGKRIAMSVAEGDRVLIPQVGTTQNRRKGDGHELTTNSTVGAPSKSGTTTFTSSAIPRFWQRSTNSRLILDSSTLTGHPPSYMYHHVTTFRLPTRTKKPHPDRPKTPCAFSENRRSSQSCNHLYLSQSMYLTAEDFCVIR